jgi:homoserine O-succinyltransferase
VLALERQNCLFVLVQGHPEYSTSSLLREYKRDLLRYLRGERPVLPPVPLHYFGDEGEGLLREFVEAAPMLSSDELTTGFPFDQVRPLVVNTWRRHGQQLYANWIREILRRKQHGYNGSTKTATPTPAGGELGTRSVGA